MTAVGVPLLQTLRGLHLFQMDSTANAVLSLLNIRQVYDTPLRLEPPGTCLSAVSASAKMERWVCVSSSLWVTSMPPFSACILWFLTLPPFLSHCLLLLIQFSSLTACWRLSLQKQVYTTEKAASHTRVILNGHLVGFNIFWVMREGRRERNELHHQSLILYCGWYKRVPLRPA